MARDFANHNYTKSYKEEVWDAVLDDLCEGISLKQACSVEGRPGRTLVKRRAVYDLEWGQMFSNARRIGYLDLADEILEISDTPVEMKQETFERRKGADGDDEEWVKTVVGDSLGHRRLQVDTRKWVLAKMLPRVYGDRVEDASDPSAPQRISKVEVVVVSAKDGSRRRDPTILAQASEVDG